MSDKTTNTFFKGAMILAISNILIKIIGAVFKIPLTRIVGDYSMGLYNTAYNYYTILLTIATAGLPIAISKMISESRALARYSLSKRIFKIALITCACLGAFGTIVMFAGPALLERVAPGGYKVLFNNPDTLASLWTLAPAVLFIAVTAALRGYFQGHGDMLPTALSQLTEALCRLFVGLAVALIFINFGFSEKLVAAGAISGITTGTLFAALLLFAIYVYRKKKSEKSGTGDEYTLTNKTIFKNLMAIAVPVTIGALVINLTNFIDTIMIPSRLSTLGVYSSKRVTELFGIYSSYAVSMFNLVPNVLISINASITPVVAAAYARRDFDDLHKVLTSALKLVIIIAAPAAIGISVLSNPILSLLFGAGESANIASGALSILSLGSLFLCVSSLASTILQSLGKATIPVYTMLIGAALKLVLNFVLIPIPGIELRGAAIATVLCYIVIAILNLAYLARFINFKLKPTVYLKPLLSTAVMGAVAYFVYILCSGFIGNLISLVVSIGIAAVCYGILLILTGGITREDALLLPKGEAIANYLKLK